MPRPGPPCGSQDPALDSPLSISLPFLAVAAFPMTGRWKEGSGREIGAGAVPAAPQAEATPASAPIRAVSVPGADAQSTGGKTGPTLSAGLQRTPPAGRQPRRRADTPPSPAPPSLRAPPGSGSLSTGGRAHRK